VKRSTKIAIVALAGGCAAIGIFFQRKFSGARAYSIAEDRGQSELTRSHNFRLIDQFSDAYALSEFADKKSIALVAVSRKCLPKPEALEIFHVSSERPLFFLAGEVGETASDYARIGTRTLFDPMGIVAPDLGLAVPGTYVELQPATGAILNRGRLPESAVGKGREVEPPPPVHPNFRSVRETFQRRCVRCHMSFDNLDYFASPSEVQHWREMMLRTLRVMRMPPGGADATLEPVKGLVRPARLRDFVQWLRDGARFDAEDEKDFASMRSELASPAEDLDRDTEDRKPVLDLTMKEAHRIPATGAAYYAAAEIYGPTERDMFIDAAEFNSNLRVFHHLNLHFLRSPLETIVSSHQQGNLQPQLASPIPGTKRIVKSTVDGKPAKGIYYDENIVMSLSRRNGIQRMPWGTAIHVPKGTYLALQFHYNPDGREETNRTHVKLYEYEGKDPPILIHRMDGRPTPMVIPAGAKKFVTESKIPVEKDISLLAFNAHMHYRGRSAKLFVDEPGKASRLVASVPYFQLKFETRLEFVSPVVVRAGSTLRIVSEYDNSSLNLANPDPKVAVPYGTSTYSNEMQENRIFYVEGRLGEITPGPAKN
jgi:hypothetical protein